MNKENDSLIDIINENSDIDIPKPLLEFIPEAPNIPKPRNYFKILATIIAVLIFTSLLMSVSRGTNNSMGDSIYPGDNEELVGMFDNCAIVHVEKKLCTIQNAYALDIPDTIYSIEILQVFKGDCGDAKRIYFHGGWNIYFTLSLYPENDTMPIVGSTYLIFANPKDDTNDALFLGLDYQKIELEGYDNNVSYEAQADYIRTIVDDYIKYI